jgi:hypothetical protein
MFLYLAIGAAMASVYDIVHNHFVRLTSSMNAVIMGNFKVPPHGPPRMPMLLRALAHTSVP